MVAGVTLGCASEYSVTIHWRGGEQVYTYVDQVESVSWARERNATTSARVQVAASGVGPTCMARLLQTYEWVHEVSIYRDRTLVWQGPLHDKTITVSGDQPIRVELVAFDVTKWLERRLPRSTRKMVDADLSDIGAAVVQECLEVEDPNVLPHVITRPSGRSASYTIHGYSRNGAEYLSEVGGMGVDWSAVGRSIYFNQVSDADTLAMASLRSSDFIGEVDIVTSGGDYASMVYAAPQEQEGVWNHLEGVGQASPYYGLVEYVVQTANPWNLDDSGNFEPSGPDGLSEAQTVRALRRAAQTRHTLMSRPPLVLRTGDNARLSASAPVDIDQLVPGVRVNLSVGFEQPVVVERAMRLMRVDVQWTTQGEEVGVSLVQIGSDELWPEE